MNRNQYFEKLHSHIVVVNPADPLQPGADSSPPVAESDSFSQFLASLVQRENAAAASPSTAVRRRRLIYPH